MVIWSHALAATIGVALAGVGKAKRNHVVPVPNPVLKPVAKRCEFCGRFAALAQHECVSCGAPLPSTGMSALDLQRLANRDASRLVEHYYPRPELLMKVRV